RRQEGPPPRGCHEAAALSRMNKDGGSPAEASTAAPSAVQLAGFVSSLGPLRAGFWLQKKQALSSFMSIGSWALLCVLNIAAMGIFEDCDYGEALAEPSIYVSFAVLMVVSALFVASFALAHKRHKRCYLLPAIQVTLLTASAVWLVLHIVTHQEVQVYMGATTMYTLVSLSLMSCMGQPEVVEDPSEYRRGSTSTSLSWQLDHSVELVPRPEPQGTHQVDRRDRHVLIVDLKSEEDKDGSKQDASQQPVQQSPPGRASRWAPLFRDPGFGGETDKLEQVCRSLTPSDDFGAESPSPLQKPSELQVQISPRMRRGSSSRSIQSSPRHIFADDSPRVTRRRASSDDVSDGSQARFGPASLDGSKNSIQSGCSDVSVALHRPKSSGSSDKQSSMPMAQEDGMPQPRHNDVRGQGSSHPSRCRVNSDLSNLSAFSDIFSKHQVLASASASEMPVVPGDGCVVHKGDEVRCGPSPAARGFTNLSNSSAFSDVSVAIHGSKFSGSSDKQSSMPMAQEDGMLEPRDSGVRGQRSSHPSWRRVDSDLSNLSAFSDISSKHQVFASASEMPVVPGDGCGVQKQDEVRCCPSPAARGFANLSNSSAFSDVSVAIHRSKSSGSWNKQSSMPMAQEDGMLEPRDSGVRGQGSSHPSRCRVDSDLSNLSAFSDISSKHQVFASASEMPVVPGDGCGVQKQDEVRCCPSPAARGFANLSNSSAFSDVSVAIHRSKSSGSWNKQSSMPMAQEDGMLEPRDSGVRGQGSSHPSRCRVDSDLSNLSAFSDISSKHQVFASASEMPVVPGDGCGVQKQDEVRCCPSPAARGFANLSNSSAFGDVVDLAVAMHRPQKPFRPSDKQLGMPMVQEDGMFESRDNDFRGQGSSHASRCRRDSNPENRSAFGNILRAVRKSKEVPPSSDQPLEVARLPEDDGVVRRTARSSRCSSSDLLLRAARSSEAARPAAEVTLPELPVPPEAVLTGFASRNCQEGDETGNAAGPSPRLPEQDAQKHFG
ncbi:unnamed protein product, partial [Polarella glacialis]